MTFWSLDILKLCVSPASVPAALGICCVSGVSSWVCLHVCFSPAGEGPAWVTCSSSIRTEVSGEQLHGLSVNAVILGRERSPELGQWGGPAQGRCHRRLFWCVFPSKDSREEVVLGSIPLPSYFTSPVGPEDRISRKYSFKVLPPLLWGSNPILGSCVPTYGCIKSSSFSGEWEEVKLERFPRVSSYKFFTHE